MQGDKNLDRVFAAACKNFWKKPVAKRKELLSLYGTTAKALQVLFCFVVFVFLD